MKKLLTIGQAAKLAKCKVELVRYYDHIHLLKPNTRTEGGNRLYNEETVKRLFFIRRARALGFSIKEITELLKCNDHYDHLSCQSVDRIAKAHVKNIQSKIDDLKCIANKLKLLLSQCKRGTPSCCSILNSLKK